jgi:hypothetical protein
MALFSDSASAETKSVTSEQAQQLSSLSGEIQSKRGGKRPGAGRPKKQIQPVVGQPASGEEEPVQAEVSPADIKFCQEVAKSALKIADKFVTDKVYKEINLIGDPNIQAKAGLFAKQVEIGDGDIELVSNAAGALAAKYPLLSAYAPECVILGWFATYSMTVMNTLKEIKALRAEVNKLRSRHAPDEDSGRATFVPFPVA